MVWTCKTKGQNCDSAQITHPDRGVFVGSTVATLGIAASFMREVTGAGLSHVMPVGSPAVAGKSSGSALFSSDSFRVQS